MAASLETRLQGLIARRDVTGARPLELDKWDLGEIAVAVRWGAMCFAVITVFSPLGVSAGRDLRRDAFGAGILVLYGVARTLFPFGAPARRGESLRPFCFETALCAIVVLFTGGWFSPLLLMVGCSLLIAGLVGGLPAFAAAVATLLGLAAAGAAAGGLAAMHGVRSALAVQRLPELVGMGAIGAYAHRIFNADDSAYNRLGWMNEVHSLLLELYSLAAEHPGLFTVEGAVNTTISRLKDLLVADVVLVLLRHPTAEGSEQPWTVAFSEGATGMSRIADADLPPALSACGESYRAQLCEQLAAGAGIHPLSVSGMYSPLIVRGALTGMLAVERLEAPEFDGGDFEILGEIARRAALAIDSARSLARLRNLGAEEERERIARELHDRVGQSLAAVAFNVDRLRASLPPQAPPELRPELELLSEEVRAVNAQIRDKLAELRGGPRADAGLAGLLADFLAKVELRSHLEVRFDHAAAGRLPEIVEREIWRIACEAIRNVERHANARRLDVVLRSDAAGTVLEVADDGKGISSEGLLRSGTYGLVGMRERADLIHATLVVDSAPEGGTVVRLRVPAR